MTQYIRIIAILDDCGDQTLVGCRFELDYVTSSPVNARTKCGRIFYKGEYEVINAEEAV